MRVGRLSTRVERGHILVCWGRRDKAEGITLFIRRVAVPWHDIVSGEDILLQLLRLSLHAFCHGFQVASLPLKNIHNLVLPGDAMAI